MIDLLSIKGLRFPDEFLVRFFYKRQHDRRAGRVLELGCGNGINLALYDASGWDVTGVDIAEEAVAAAQHNLQGRGRLVQHDLRLGLPRLAGRFDVLLVPSSLCYLPREACRTCLRQLRDYCAPRAELYLRMRLIDDYRYGRGALVERNGFQLEIKETGEEGSLNVFYEEYELLEMCQSEIGLDVTDLALLHVRFDNLQSGVIVANSDLVIWGALG